jgi:hypothetical protein
VTIMSSLICLEYSEDELHDADDGWMSRFGIRIHDLDRGTWHDFLLLLYSTINIISHKNHLTQQGQIELEFHPFLQPQNTIEPSIS